MVIWANGLPWFPVYKAFYVLCGSWNPASCRLLKLVGVVGNGFKQVFGLLVYHMKKAVSMSRATPDARLAELGKDQGSLTRSSTITPIWNFVFWIKIKGGWVWVWDIYFWRG
jgi:hypothetical protein